MLLLDLVFFLRIDGQKSHVDAHTVSVFENALLYIIFSLSLSLSLSRHVSAFQYACLCVFYKHCRYCCLFVCLSWSDSVALTLRIFYPSHCLSLPTFFFF